MIAWTSPWPTVEVDALEDLVLGSATGATRRPRMTRRVVVGVAVVGRCGGSVTMRQGSSAVAVAAGRGAVGRASARHEVGQGHRVERAGDRVADADPEEVDGAARPCGRRRARARGSSRRADHRGDRAFEGAQDLAHRDLGGRTGELVAAVGAAGAHDEAGVAQADHELLEVGPRQVLLGGDLGQAGRPGAVVAAELDHQPNAVLALRREGDGAAAVEAGFVCSGRLPRIPSRFRRD